MEECVKAWDAYVEAGDFLCLKDFWKKEGYEEKFGITYKSFHNYARDDKTKQTPLYSKPERPSSQSLRDQSFTVTDVN